MSITKSSTISFLSGNWLSVLVLILVVILFFNRNPFGCNPPQTDSAKPRIDTVIKESTVYVPQPPVQIPVYVPVESSRTTPVVIPPQYKPSEEIAALTKQYNDLVKE